MVTNDWEFATSQWDWEQIDEQIAHVQHGKYFCAVFLFIAGVAWPGFVGETEKYACITECSPPQLLCHLQHKKRAKESGIHYNKIVW